MGCIFLFINIILLMSRIFRRRNNEQLIGEFYQLENYKHYSPEKARVTFKELLTMSSPFDGNDDDFNLSFYP